MGHHNAHSRSFNCSFRANYMQQIIPVQGSLTRRNGGGGCLSINGEIAGETDEQMNAGAEGMVSQLFIAFSGKGHLLIHLM